MSAPDSTYAFDKDLDARLRTAIAPAPAGFARWTPARS